MNNNQRKTLAIFGGTFDPIHYGHIQPLEYAAKQCELDEIIVMPCHLPPHKAKPNISKEHRVTMIKLAIENNPLFKIDLFEINRNSPSYTIDTLTYFKKNYPIYDLCFFMGQDSYFNLTKWYKWQEILTLAKIVVLSRPMTTKTFPDNEFLSPYLCKDLRQFRIQKQGCILTLETPMLNISSSEIKRMLKLGEDVSKLMPESVLNYIQTHHLYC